MPPAPLDKSGRPGGSLPGPAARARVRTAERKGVGEEEELAGHLIEARVPAVHGLHRMEDSGGRVAAVQPIAQAVADDAERVDADSAEVIHTIHQEEVLAPGLPVQLPAPVDALGVLL